MKRHSISDWGAKRKTSVGDWSATRSGEPTSKYASAGGYQIMHDNGESGTGKWIVSQDPDNPLAFCRTLKGTRRFIHLALKAGDAPTR